MEIGLQPDMHAEAEDERAARLRAASRVHSTHASAGATSFAPLVRMGTDILKAVALLNGGAGAATVFVIGSVVSNDPGVARALVPSLAAFGFGLAVASFATGWSYLSHASHADALARMAHVWRAPFVEDTAASTRARRRGDRFATLAFAAVMVSMASAVAGFAMAGLGLLGIGT